MEEDSLIRVLHYRNPHLLWVEVKNLDTYSLRQVGLFGIVPRQASVVDGERVCTKTDSWDSRANDIVEEFLETKHQLSFKSTYRLDDDQTSIFHNHPHIFGEISSVRKGVKKQLSNCLDSSVYAYKSKNEFWQMLDKGTIKTKLDTAEEIDVLENIINCYKEKGLWHKRKSIFLKHLSPVQLSMLNKFIAEESPEKLTVENLEKHRILTTKHNIRKPEIYIGEKPRILTNKNDKAEYIGIEKPMKTEREPTRAKKYQDFNHDKELAPVEFVENVIKKYTIVEKAPVVENKKYTVRDDVGETGSLLSKVTVYDEEINPDDSGDEIEAYPRTKGRANSRQNRHLETSSNKEIKSEILKVKDLLKHKNRLSNESTPSKDKNFHSSSDSSNLQKGHKDMKNRMTQKEKSDSFKENEDSGRNSSPSLQYQEHLVAYGPPTSNKQHLVRKLVKKIDSTPPKQEESQSNDHDDDDKGKIQWFNDDPFDFNEELCKDLPKKLDVDHTTIVTDKVDRKGDFKSVKKYDLNEPKDYNDFVQSKNNMIKESSSERFFHNEHVNEKDDTTQIQMNKENKSRTHKPKSKLLEMVRKRTAKLNDSSSTDDSSFKNDDQVKPNNRNVSNDTNSEDETDKASPSVQYQEHLVAYGPPMSNQQHLVRKLVKKIDSTPPKQEESQSNDHDDDDKGKIQWFNDDPFDFNEELCKDLPKKLDVDHTTIVTDKVERKGDFKSVKKYDLNEPKDYNDFVQSKNNMIKESSSERFFHNEHVNEKDDTTQIQMNKENANTSRTHKPRSKLLEIVRKRTAKLNDSLSTDDSSVKNDDPVKPNNLNVSNDTNSEDELEQIHAKLSIKNEPKVDVNKKTAVDNEKTNVNPFKNLDGSKSVFVENLVQPLLLAHAKNNNKVFPQSNMRDVPFKVEIKNTLRNMQVKNPSRLQSVSWPYILRGHSLFMISPYGSGKTLGYLPAVCNLVLDYHFGFSGLGPICIIVCATSISVATVTNMCRIFVSKKVIPCFPGLDYTKLMTDIVNGCDILVSTPSLLYRLLGAEIGVDLRRLTTVVFDDCEFLADVYELELKAVQLYVKKMLKSRTDKQVKVQYILASRKWCEMMGPLAKKTPDTIMVFTAFHECVFYSKSKTSVSFVKKNNKVDAVIEFLKDTDDSKLSVIVCRTDDEVDLLKSTLINLNHKVVACNNQMTIHDLYKIRNEELSSILICCDSNLKQLNVTYASYLVHFSMPAVYTQFCARFSVLNDNYSSIFGPENDDVKIKILLEETNVEQLPKILNFVKRCSGKVPEVLEKVALQVLEQKDLEKAEILVPICENLFSLGECVDFDVCQSRHAILQKYDEPKPWMPRNGVITFKIINYNTATSYSARLLTHGVGTDKTKYPETYGTLCLKLGMFFSKEYNKRLHGEPNVGDVCAVPIRNNFIARCRVLKINSYEKGKAKSVVINLIDEEQITVARAVELYYLPEKFKNVETHVVKVQLAGIRPQDKDVTFSELAMNKLKKITNDEEDLYLRGKVAMTVGNTIIVSTLEACAELSELCETVVKHDFKMMLLNTHAIPHPEHLNKLQKLCEIGDLKVNEPEKEMTKLKPRTVKKEVEYRWAHLDKNDWTDVIFCNTINPSKFLVRPQKFSKCINSLISDIKKHVEDNPKSVDEVAVKDVVLAEFPDDAVYERAMIEEIIDENKVKCFFVDNADWRDVSIDKIKPIPQKFVKQIPFQSIECRLVGVKPPGHNWTEFSTNWLHDNCLEDFKGDSKRLFVKYFKKEVAEMTGGHKYGVVLVDTTNEDDVIINKKMIELNLASIDENEVEYLEKPLDFVREKTDTSSYEDDFDELENKQENKDEDKPRSEELIPIPIRMIPNNKDEDMDDGNIKNDEITPYIQNNGHINNNSPLNNVFAAKPLRSVPLVSDSDEDSDKWDVCFDGTLGECFGLPKLSQSYNDYNKITENNDRNAYVADTPNKDVKDTTKILAIADDTVKDNKSDCKRIEETETVASNVDNNTTNKEKSKYLIINPEVMESVSKRFRQFGKRMEDISIQKESAVPVEYTNVLKGHIKDVSVYDSDDTLSISTVNDKIEITMGPNKVHQKETLLDSDDTQSFCTDDKEISILKDQNKGMLESDDSVIEERTKPRIEEIDAEKLVENKNGDTIGKAAYLKTDLCKVSINEISKVEMASDDNNIDRNGKISKPTNINKEQQKDTEKERTIEMKGRTITVTQTTEPTRTPQLVWKQDKNKITIKIKVIVDEYTLETGNRSLKFSAYQNEVKYAFDIELYGIIKSEETKHANKGQYILVTLSTMQKKTTRWLKLTKEFKNWIIYDVDSIDTSSDEETPVNKDALKIIMDKHEKSMDDYNDDDIDDTSGFRYRDYD